MGKKLIALAAGVATLSMASAAFALSANDYTLFDSAQYISPGNASARAVQLTSNATSTDGGIDFGSTTGLTVADLTNLSTDYRFDAGSCGGGSPRFQVNVETASGTKNIFVYLGAAPNYTGCPQGVWTNSGNLVASTSVVDATQLGGGFYEPWSQVVADYGTDQISGIQLVADGGWAFPTTGQVVSIDNTTINSTRYTYEVPVNPTPTTKNECKDGGWQNLADGQGHAFTNQGQCVSYVASNRSHTR